MTTAFDLVAQGAPDFGGTFTTSSHTSGILDLPVKLVDGRTVSYRLQLNQVGDQITAREESPRHLPSFCPERHINPDGTFCLYFSGTTRLDVVDEASAIAWLETVYKYLKLQERARVQRKWPNNEEWAHGDAAHHQYRAQVAAAALNNHFASALAEGLLQLKERRSKDRQRILELWIENTYMFSVWEAKAKVINQKQRCFCGTSGLRMPKRLRGCADHARRASELVLSLRDWEKAEERYWGALTRRTCCGTCDSCPLQRPS